MYKISFDEFLAWERNLDRSGIPGLRTTRYQIYRDNMKFDTRSATGREKSRAGVERFGIQLGPSPMPNGRAVEIDHRPCRKPFSDYVAKKP